MRQRDLDPEYLKATIEIKDFTSIRQIFRSVEPADIGAVLSKLPIVYCIVLFRLVQRHRKVEVFAYISNDRRLELIEELPDVLVTSLLNEMEPDDRTHLLEGLPYELRKKTLLRLSPEERNIAWKLLSYPEDSVGRLMTPDFMIVQESMNASQALEYIRWSSELPPEFLNRLFIINESGKLSGEITLAELVKADPPSVLVRDIMSNNTVALEPHTNQELALKLFKKYDRLIVPVVDAYEHVIGIVSADDMFDVAEDVATEDIQQFGGQKALEDSYFNTPISTMIKKRAGWLCLLFFGMLFSGSILRHYEQSVDQLAYLIIFLPMVISAGGNSGTQSASLIIRGLALSEMDESHWMMVLKREIIISLSLGVILGILGYMRASFWNYPLQVCFVVAFTLLCVVVFGALAGSLLPFLFKRLRLDPAVVSSPFVTTIVDLSGITIFIKVATLLAGI